MRPCNQSIGAVGASIASSCPCAVAPTPADFKHCVNGVVATAISSAQLPAGCKRYILGVYLPSTCGYPSGTVACATRHLAGGRAHCRILKPGLNCSPKRRVIACANPFNCYNAAADTSTYLQGIATGSCTVGP